MISLALDRVTRFYPKQTLPQFEYCPQDVLYFEKDITVSTYHISKTIPTIYTKCSTIVHGQHHACLIYNICKSLQNSSYRIRCPSMPEKCVCIHNEPELIVRIVIIYMQKNILYIKNKWCNLHTRIHIHKYIKFKSKNLITILIFFTIIKHILNQKFYLLKE